VELIPRAKIKYNRRAKMIPENIRLPISSGEEGEIYSFYDVDMRKSDLYDEATDLAKYLYSVCPAGAWRDILQEMCEALGISDVSEHQEAFSDAIMRMSMRKKRWKVHKRITREKNIIIRVEAQTREEAEAAVLAGQGDTISEGEWQSAEDIMASSLV